MKKTKQMLSSKSKTSTKAKQGKNKKKKKNQGIKVSSPTHRSLICGAVADGQWDADAVRCFVAPKQLVFSRVKNTRAAVQLAHAI